MATAFPHHPTRARNDQAGFKHANSLTRLATALFTKQKASALEMSVIIPHCTGKLCSHFYRKDNRSKLNPKVSLETAVVHRG